MSARTVTTREAAPGDGEALASIWLDNARYYLERFPDDFRLPHEDGLADWFEEGLERSPDPDSFLTVVGELDGQVVGFANGRIEPAMENAVHQMLPHLGAATLRIDVLGVASTHWRRGVATALVTAIEEWGRSRGAAASITNTYHDSAVSVPFWERGAGYRRRGLILVKRLVAE